MSNNLYVTAVEGRSGKGVVVLGVMEMILKEIGNAAFFRPIVSDTVEGEVDNDVRLVIDHFGLDQPYERASVCTLTEARHLLSTGGNEELLGAILKHYKELEADYDFVVCEGTDFDSVDPGFEFDLNALVAQNIGAPLLLVVSGRDKSPDDLHGHIMLTIDAFAEREVDLAACIVNRAQSTGATLLDELSARSILTYVIPENRSLGNPTVEDVRAWLDAKVLYGGAGLSNLVDGYVVAAMQVNNFLNYITPGSLVITPGDRADIVLAVLASRLSTNYPDVSGIVLTAGFQLEEPVGNLIEGWTGVPVPVLHVDRLTFDTVQDVQQLRGQITAKDSKRITTALGWFARYVNVPELTTRVAAQRSDRITPRMFEYSLVEKAAADRQRIVLCEGTSDRILAATDVILRRGIADITLLGDIDQIRERAARLQVNIDGAQLIDPAHSDLHLDFASTYVELRKSKGILLEAASDRMLDPTYFGTMMVHKGLAGGMVSGSITTTAQTIRPAFEFIKTKPGVSTVSSIFIMCFNSQVLAFGDCAVVPNPDARQLAEIAVSSAETAQIFGIEPRIAMLSYSTGTSGAGAEVERVAEATRIAQQICRERGLDFPIEGPIQYDAAIDPTVGQLKLPGSAVAGKATVFIFPDLNTGNNTYKAVQRAADAVAMGPVLQGLNKPVNDLSRGCTVPDIVATVALTAIQAQMVAADARSKTARAG